jgi:hypothetical protein
MIASVSSERRNYIPTCFQEPEVIASNLCFTVEAATLFSLWCPVLGNAHGMSKKRLSEGSKETVATYRYSNEIVYNTFPWPQGLTDTQRQRVIDCADRVMQLGTNSRMQASRISMTPMHA